MASILIVLGVLAAVAILVWFLLKKFKKEWNPYIALIGSLIKVFKNFLSAIDKNPEEYSKLEIAVEGLDKGFEKIQDLVSQQEVIMNMEIDKQISYIADSLKETIYDSLKKLGVKIDAETESVVNTVLSLLSFFIAPLFKKKEN